MDTNNQNLQNNTGDVEEDRISELPHSILHHILSFLDTKHVARTCVLSKRWKHLWTSIPTLVFPYQCYHYSLSETNKFVEFVDRTLLLHDTSSNIQKFGLTTNRHMSASRVHSWIEYLIKNHVQNLNLSLDHDKPFSIPLSLFTCESLVKLELRAKDSTCHPRSFFFPKLKTLKFYGTKFCDDCWNEQTFSNCPVLKILDLEDCTWYGVRNFCISSPTLKVLNIVNVSLADDGLGNCTLKIQTPNLVSLDYGGHAPKKYVLSSFQKLKSATVQLSQDGVLREQRIGYGAAVSKFFRALSQVPSLTLFSSTLQTLSKLDDFTNILPTFHDLEELILTEGTTTDSSLLQLFKAVPNLKWLTFEESCVDDNKEEEHSWAGHMLTAGPIFQQLESVTFESSSGNARQIRWVKLILKNAIALEEVILWVRSDDAINKEVFVSELRTLARTSERCEFKLEEYS